MHMVTRAIELKIVEYTWVGSPSWVELRSDHIPTTNKLLQSFFGTGLRAHPQVSTRLFWSVSEYDCCVQTCPNEGLQTNQSLIQPDQKVQVGKQCKIYFASNINTPVAYTDVHPPTTYVVAQTLIL